MQTLVTGGAGFIGSNLAHRLVAEGHVVRVVDDLSTGRLANLDGVEVDLVEGSIADPGMLREAMKGAEVVFHEAALPSVARSVRDPLPTHEAATTGTLNVLIAAREAGVRRFVYASSSSVYGNDPVLPRREDRAPQPVSPYAAAKLAGEMYCKAFAGSYGLETVALRYFNVFGPRQDPDGEYAAVVPKFITKVLQGEAPRIDGAGDQTRDFTFVANVVDANLLAAAADPAKAVGQAFNVATGERTSVTGLLELIWDVAGGGVPPVHGPARVGDVRDSWADISAAQSALGFTPAVSLRRGLAITKEWLAPSVGAALAPSDAAG